MVASVSFGRVAQLVEHLTFNQVAPGSNPGALTKLKRRDFLPFFFAQNLRRQIKTQKATLRVNGGRFLKNRIDYANGSSRFRYC